MQEGGDHPAEMATVGLYGPERALSQLGVIGTEELAEVVGESGRPALRGQALTLQCCGEGIAGEQFSTQSAHHRIRDPREATHGHPVQRGIGCERRGFEPDTVTLVMQHG